MLPLNQLRSHAFRSHVCALMAFGVVALAFAWPLPLHLSTHLTGDPAGDTGIYVWNQWLFRHELIERHHLPYFTDRIFASGQPANLSLHNYTTFQNLVALPLIGAFGVVAAFNVVLLLMSVISAYMTFLLVKQVGGPTAEAWVGGLLFAWSPVLVTRSAAHFSLVAAAPLAAFLLVLLRADDRLEADGHIPARYAWGLGAATWWAASTDVYFAVYTVIIGLAFAAARLFHLRRSTQPASTVRRALVGATAMAGVAVAAIAVSGGGSFAVLGVPVRMRTLYTPMLLLTVLTVSLIAHRYRLSLAPSGVARLWRFARLGAMSAAVAAVALSPLLYAAARRTLDGRFQLPALYWRSSPPGIDALALLVPNPNHPLLPRVFADWVSARPNGYEENVASIPLVAVLILAVAVSVGWRAPRIWAGLGGLFGLLSLGPFIHVGGVNTFIPGPWALLRYVPVIGLARTPTRLAIPLMLVVVVLTATALAWAGNRYPQYRRRILGVITAALIFELWPAPRTLFSAAVPFFYQQIAAARDDVRLLELPFGLRDGASSVGNATARSQYFQTVHGKSIQGGYLSRVSRQRVDDVRRDQVLDALLDLSENQQLAPDRAHALVNEGPAYVRRAKIGFVVVDSDRTSPQLRDLAIQAFQLQRVTSDGALDLYATPLESSRFAVMGSARD